MGEIVLAEELPSLEEIAGLPRMCQGKTVLGGGIGGTVVHCLSGQVNFGEWLKQYPPGVFRCVLVEKLCSRVGTFSFTVSFFPKMFEGHEAYLCICGVPKA